MSLYTIVFILVTILILGALGLFFYFLSWLDRKIEEKDRIGASAYKKKKKAETKSEE